MFARKRRANSGQSAGYAALAISVLALVMATTGFASAATKAVSHEVSNLVDGHAVSTKPHKNGLLVLGKDGKFPANAIPTNIDVDSAKTADRAKTATSAKTATNAKNAKNATTAETAKTADTAKTAKTATTAMTADTAKTAKTATTAANATDFGGKTLTQMTDGCPQGTADIGTWCLMIHPYPLTQEQVQDGVNNYPWASQACVAIGGFLPDAAQLIGAAKVVKLESTVDDNPATATVQGGDAGTTASDQREMSATLITTAAGSDAAGSEGVSADTVVDPASGEPQPTPEPAVPFPPTLQYVTVYSNGTTGGFAGSEPVSTAENFRCGFYLQQGGANQTLATPNSSTATITTQDATPAG